MHKFRNDYGNNDLFIKDLCSGVKAAYIMPDKSGESTMEAIRRLTSDRQVARLYSDRLGEIDKAVRALLI